MVEKNGTGSDPQNFGQWEEHQQAERLEVLLQFLPLVRLGGPQVTLPQRGVLLQAFVHLIARSRARGCGSFAAWQRAQLRSPPPGGGEERHSDLSTGPRTFQSCVFSFVAVWFPFQAEKEKNPKKESRLKETR